MNYEEVKAEYYRLVKKLLSAGYGEDLPICEKLADLEEDYPDFIEAIEEE